MRKLKVTKAPKPAPPEPLRHTLSHAALDAQLKDFGGLQGVLHGVVVMLSGKPPNEIKDMLEGIQAREAITVSMRIGQRAPMVCTIA